MANAKVTKTIICLGLILYLIGGGAYAAKKTNDKPNNPVKGHKPPTISLSASPTTVSMNGFTTINWSSKRARECTASGDWSGSKATSGSQTIGALNTDSTFNLSCSGAGGSITESVNITVEASSTPSITDPVKAAVTSLVDSDDPTIAATATTLAERYRPRGRFEGLGSRLAGTLFWALLLAPALTAVGFATYFVARLLQELAGGTRRLAAAAVSFVWFGSSVALGLALFAGVLGFGHGGRLSAGVYGVLAILDAVFFGLGCLLALAVRKPQKAPG